MNLSYVRPLNLRLIFKIYQFPYVFMTVKYMQFSPFVVIYDFFTAGDVLFWQKASAQTIIYSNSEDSDNFMLIVAVQLCSLWNIWKLGKENHSNHPNFCFRDSCGISLLESDV